MTGVRRVTTVICAWCGVTMTAGDPTLPISHGCCATCTDRFLKETA